jgi:glucose/arabinose dehydrogenase
VSPTAVRFAADGTMFVAEQAGRVRRFNAPGDPPGGRVVVDVSTETNSMWDRGLLGLALDPGFLVNRRLYLLYTYDAPPGETAPRWNDDCPPAVGATDNGCVVTARIVRVTLSEVGAAASIDTLLADQWCTQFPSHSVGTLQFGPDGALYASHGDGANWVTDWGQYGGGGGVPANPCGDPPGGTGTPGVWPTAEGGSFRAQDVRTRTDPTGLDGAIARIDPATGAPLPGGPFAGNGLDANASRIIAFGLRNPFRFTFRPGTSELWVGDVGLGHTEEIDRVPHAADGTGENFGWPCYEGSGASDSWATADLCSSLAPDAVTAPYFGYPHDDHVAAGDGCPTANGAAISGLAFRSGGDWPTQYEDALFFADYARGCIWWMRAGAGGLPDTATVAPFARTSGGGPVDLQAGPGGDLYAVVADGLNPGDGMVVRYAYRTTGPAAAVTASTDEGAVPLDVHLDAGDTTDGDGQALTYAWDLDHDDQYDDATGVAVDHTFTAAGTVTVRLKATDPDGLWDVTAVTLHPGNTRPAPAIGEPAAAVRFSVGETIHFHGSAADAEDGTLGPAALQWTLTMMHGTCPACHPHQIQTWSGADGSFTAPDHEFPSHLVLSLKATDSGGLSRTVERELQPRLATVRVETTPAGVPVRLLDRGDVPSPQQVTVFDGAKVTLGVPPSVRVGSEDWALAGWSDGATAAQRVVEAHGAMVLRARYAAPGGPALPAVQTDRTGPRVAVTPPRRRPATRVVLAVACTDEPCRIRVAARLEVGGRERSLRARARWLKAGARIRLGFDLDRRARSLAARGLAAGRRARVRFAVTATDAHGNATTRRLSVRLRRR